MNKKITISIGIPAHNEGVNIKSLIKSIVLQKNGNYLLDKIIIVSDGSTDNTISEVKSIKNKHILLVENRKRAGKPNSLNLIFKKSTSNVLILLDADVKINDSYFISKVANIFKPKNNVLITTQISPKAGKLFIEKILTIAEKTKDGIFENIKNTNPVYLVNGRGLILFKNFYKKLLIPLDVIADDAFIGLTAITNNIAIIKNNNLKIQYKLSKTLSDYINQSTRFSESTLNMSKYFDEKFIKKEYVLPKSIVFKHLFLNFLKYPVYIISYLFLLTFSKVITILKVKKHTHLWKMSASSKT